MCTDCYKAASEESRHKILLFLKSTGESTVSEITKHLKLKQPTVSHHLQLLTERKFLTATSKGRERFYQLDLGSQCLVDCGIVKSLVN